MSQIHDKIIELAKADLGIKEVGHNLGWEGPGSERLTREMIDVGWKSPQPYCAYWGKKIVIAAYEAIGHPELVRSVEDVFSPLAQKCLSNAKLSRFKVGLEPIPGAIGIMAYGTTAKGHLFIVEKYENGYLYTFEANTNRMGTREGDGIYQKKRLNSTRQKKDGLWLKGFIYPIEV